MCVFARSSKNVFYTRAGRHTRVCVDIMGVYASVWFTDDVVFRTKSPKAPCCMRERKDARCKDARCKYAKHEELCQLACQAGAVEEQDKESSKNEARRLRISAMWRRKRRTTRPERTAGGLPEC